jgi:hypothetical protein
MVEAIDFAALNWVGIGALTVGLMALGFAWYASPVLGNRWAAALGTTVSEIQSRGSQPRAYAMTVVAAIIQMIGLAIIIQLTGASQVVDGLVIGALAGFALVGAVMATQYSFEGRPNTLFAINAGFAVVALSISGIVLAVWESPF